MADETGRALREQNLFMDEFTDKMDTTESYLNNVVKRIEKVLDSTDDNKQIMIIVVLAIILIILVLLYLM